MVVTCQEMADAEEKLFSGNVSAEPFMDEAGRLCAEAIRGFFPEPGFAHIFCGPGNNGGDSLVVARWLKSWGWEIELNFSHGAGKISPLAVSKLEQYEAESSPDASGPKRDRILVDGLLGIGARGDLRGGVREQADRIHQLRHDQFASCFAIDIPTGLDGDTGQPYEGAVEADYTLSITAAKTGFAADAATPHVGRLVEIPLDIPVSGDESVGFLFPSSLKPRLLRRKSGTHKGKAGRVTLIAGSRGYTGAALLTALGASRSGAGLTTLCVEEEIYPIIAARCPAEVMVRPLGELGDVLDPEHDVLAIGPGLGSSPRGELVELIWQHPAPMVVDADAINALARDSRPLSDLPSNRLLTPHPGELERLLAKEGHGGDEGRVDLTRKLADEWGITLLHKGSRTAIATPAHPVELNTTGHPGMASGGMGDILTGMCASLAGQGLSLHDSACVGSWLLGRAAELARDRNRAAEASITAVQVAENIGAALRDLETESP